MLPLTPHNPLVAQAQSSLPIISHKHFVAPGAGTRRSVASWCDVRGCGALWSPAPPLPPHHSRHSGGGEGPGPLPTAGKRRAGVVTPVVHASVLAVIATLLRHKTFFLRVLPCCRRLPTPWPVVLLLTAAPRPWSVVLPLTPHNYSASFSPWDLCVAIKQTRGREHGAHNLQDWNSQ